MEGRLPAGADDLHPFIGGRVVASSKITILFKEVFSMKPETKGKIKYSLWGLVVGAVIAMIIGFGWGGWSTAGTTQQKSKEAVLASQAAICVAQFIKQPNAKEKLKELSELNSWKRAEFIEKGGWDKMPGQEKADYSVSRACVDGLELIAKK
jgi:hypothetical protein